MPESSLSGERRALEIGPNGDDNGHAPAAPTLRDWLLHTVPALESLRGYNLRALRLDLLAGLTVAAVAVPQAMAYASIIPNVPPAYGLYTAIVMTAVGALLDSSRQLINGPTNAICIALASALAIVPDAERLPAAILMAFLVGVFQTMITLFRLGDLTRFISQSVIVGFTLGAAVLLALGQMRSFLGLPRLEGADHHFLVHFYHETIGQADQINRLAVDIGAATIALALLSRGLGRWLRSQLPDFLIALLVMAGCVWYFGWQDKVRVVGEIPSGLPALAIPDFSWARIQQLTSSALAIAVLGLLEAIAMAKVIAARTQQKLDINQQCLSEGLANFVGSFFHCFPGSGSLTRSAINVQAGAVSQWSGVFAALAVALTVLLFAPLARYIPYAALAGLLLISAWRLVDRKQLFYHLRTTRFDMQIVLATALSAVFINVEFCILIGVFLSVALYVRRAARLHMTELVLTPERVLRERDPSDPRCDRILLFSLEGELFFGSAPDLDRHFEELIARLQPATKAIVLRVKRVRNPDAVCLERFERFIAKVQQRGVNLILCGVRKDFAQALTTSGVAGQLGKEYIFVEQEGAASSTVDAVRFAYELLKMDYCTVCPRRTESAKEPLYYMI